MIIKFIYSLFLGILIVTFVHVGISAFYPEPKNPEYPIELQRPYPPKEEDLSAKEREELNRKQMEYDKNQKAFQETIKEYNRNVSIISLIAALLSLVASLTFIRSLLVISDGILLGGVFTLIYSIVRGFSAQDNMYRFIVVSIGLFVAIILGYVKFVKPTLSSKK